MKTVNGDFKFEGMKKEQDFIIYPCSATDDQVLLQSDKRIIRVELSTGKAILSKGGRCYAPDLHPLRGAKMISLDRGVIDKIRTMRDTMAGVNPNGVVVIDLNHVETIKIGE